MTFRVGGWTSRVWSLGFTVWDLGFGVPGLGFTVLSLRSGTNAAGLFWEGATQDLSYLCWQLIYLNTGHVWAVFDFPYITIGMMYCRTSCLYRINIERVCVP